MKITNSIIQDNLEELYEVIPFSVYKEGYIWYYRANSLAKDISSIYNIDFNIVCGLISAFSPIKSWKENIKLVHNFITKGRCGHTKYNLDKAKLIYNINKSTKDKDSYICGVLNAPKTKNFYMNIAYPDNKNYVTIDRHQIQLMTQGYKKDVRNINVKQYNFLKENMIEFAERKNLIPCQAQSILWVYYKDAKWGRI